MKLVLPVAQKQLIILVKALQKYLPQMIQLKKMKAIHKL